MQEGKSCSKQLSALKLYALNAPILILGDVSNLCILSKDSLKTENVSEKNKERIIDS